MMLLGYLMVSLLLFESKLKAQQVYLSSKVTEYKCTVCCWGKCYCIYLHCTIIHILMQTKVHTIITKYALIIIAVVLFTRNYTPSVTYLLIYSK